MAKEITVPDYSKIEIFGGSAIVTIIPKTDNTDKKITIIKLEKEVIKPIPDLTTKDIIAKRALIRKSCPDRYPNVTSKLIAKLFWLYDDIFLNNFMSVDFKALKCFL